MISKVFVDTDIFMYARGKDHPLKTFCSKIIFKIAKKEPITHYGIPVIDTEVFQEIFYRYAMIRKWELGIIACRDIQLLDMEVLSIRNSEVTQFLELAEIYKKKGIPPRDLIHTSVMTNNGIHYIISSDKHFDKIKEVHRIAPEKI